MNGMIQEHGMQQPAEAIPVAKKQVVITIPLLCANFGLLKSELMGGLPMNSDRALPSCATCLKSGQPCEYPESAQKPGPKTGTGHRSRKRSRDDKPTESSQSSSLHGELACSRDNMVNYPTIDTLESPRLHRQRLDSTRSSQSEYRSPGGIPPDTVGLPSPVHSVATPGSSVSVESKGNSLSQIIHPSHDPPSPPPKLLGQHEFVDLEDRTVTTKRITLRVCETLRISADSYQFLLSAYFENMTAFSLFHRPRFDQKLRNIHSPLQAQALLAAMFSFSARFRDRGSARLRADLPSPQYFHKIALSLINDALEACADETPPLCILQAMILTTFQQLISGVRGRAWRSLGNCIRVAYELDLHLVDSRKGTESDTISEQGQQIVEKWVLKEEDRRTWWALWEFDVFASTIRRMPTAIDWSHNETYLPVDDDMWFSNIVTPSCYLALDPHQRWKVLEKSVNKGGKAWFIVVNSLMRDAQSLSTLQTVANPVDSGSSGSLPGKPRNDLGLSYKTAEEAEGEMSAISDALYCATIALPINQAHRGELLSFKASEYIATTTSRQNDASKYSIHIMKQLSKFMIYHRRVFHGPWRDLGSANTVLPSSRGPSRPNQGAWSRYLDGADEILTIIRNSSPDHIQYVNPFLANAIWLAAAAQVACRIFGPPVANQHTVEANLDLLRLTFNRFVSFWDLSSTLQEKLYTLESRLKSVQASEAGTDLDNNNNNNNNSHGMPTFAFSRNNDISMKQSIKVASNERVEHFPGISPYYQSDVITTPSDLMPYVNPDCPMPPAPIDFSAFSIQTSDEFLTAWGLEELLTYGYS